ncbi:MAG: GNAT family N-acetyltransferase [Luminiphilus sp.]
MTPASSTQAQVLTASDLYRLEALYSEGEGPSLTFLAELLRRPHGCAWFITEEGAALAVAWFSVVLDEVEIIDIRVAHSHRRQGLGERLLRESLAALSARSVFLDVRRTNSPAVAMYEKMGFLRVGVRHNYYQGLSGREDAVVMRLELGVE